LAKTIALISDHASPLAAVGGIDSGGQNVSVAQVQDRTDLTTRYRAGERRIR
jgi:hypothetical protein